MPPRDWKFRVDDILKAVERIRDYTEDMDYEQFKNDPRTVDAVVRNLITIGEAAARIPEEVIAENAEIPWSDMRDMRNFVVHEYFRVSHRMLWNTVVHDIRDIEVQLQGLVE